MNVSICFFRKEQKLAQNTYAQNRADGNGGGGAMGDHSSKFGQKIGKISKEI